MPDRARPTCLRVRLGAPGPLHGFECRAQYIREGAEDCRPEPVAREDQGDPVADRRIEPADGDPVPRVSLCRERIEQTDPRPVTDKGGYRLHGLGFDRDVPGSAVGRERAFRLRIDHVFGQERDERLSVEVGRSDRRAVGQRVTFR